MYGKYKIIFLDNKIIIFGDLGDFPSPICFKNEGGMEVASIVWGVSHY